MKKHLTLLALACLLVTNAFAQQSEAQKQWVPTHEFTIDLFGGISNLNYKVDPHFMNVTHNWTDAMAGGLGFGYTWHANDWFGITTGVEFALYRGGFKYTGETFSLAYLYEDRTFAAISWRNKGWEPIPGGAGNTYWNNVEFSEKQNVYAVQIPLKVNFMAPLNDRKSNHFYAAVGAKIGFNVFGDYTRSDVQASAFNPKAGVQYAFSGTHTPWNTPLTQAVVDHSFVEAISDNFVATYAAFFDANGNQIQPADFNYHQWLSLMTQGDYASDPDYSTWTEKNLGGKGKNALELIQVMASIDLGFRWGLTNGWGLYTGLYFDYGFLPMFKDGGKFFNYSYTIEDGNTSAVSRNYTTFREGSMLACTYDDPGIYSVLDPNVSVKMGETRANVPISSKVTNVAAGLKLKLAFGSAKPKPAPEPIIQYVERIVRDTVTVVNTVIQKDTVVNTVIQKDTVTVRDTVTVIKEVPVEIRKVMADLSNSLFDTGKAIIKDQAKGPLYTVVMWLKENPNAKVEVSGHTDNVGGAAYNQKLSEARAKAVYDYFIASGVNADRLSYAGYGMDRPIAPNDTPQGRQQNRRVELNVIE